MRNPTPTRYSLATRPPRRISHSFCFECPDLSVVVLEDTGRAYCEGHGAAALASLIEDAEVVARAVAM